MSKQIKLGFDKNTSRPLLGDQILVDTQGNFLRDSIGDFLYTETNQVPRSFFAAKKSTSTHINNEFTPIIRSGGSISVLEQFPETSAVSSSILGIPRAQRQQTLLSDVSIYGLDDTWEFYRTPVPFQPIEWRERNNDVYGKRYDARLAEHPNEQALALELFRVPWTFPFGPRWGDGSDRHRPELFRLYRNFIELGNILYDYYTGELSTVSQPALRERAAEIARKNFLPPEMAKISGDDVEYNPNTNLAFQAIERWTLAWIDIGEGIFENPLRPSTNFTVSVLEELLKDVLLSAIRYLDTRPGYSSTSYTYCQLQSKEAFRYQPGAISGFTFGVKLNANPTANDPVIEWGCANETDQLMFQVSGRSFNIVRRSTVPLTRKNLELNGLRLEDQKIVQSPNPFERNDNVFVTSDLGLPPDNRTEIHEIVISDDKFNGDPLDGSGPSGHIISFNEVTMYKIEYSWYGAVGAKFYAYVPAGNDETRWVLIHTLVIENTLDFPSLQNPFMHFRYSIYMNNSDKLREPVYLYKYGASYYIDGDDEGTFTYESFKIPSERPVRSTNSTPLIGFISKDKILNRDGKGTFNQKNFYIDDISVSSSKSARIDILECDGCPGGHGHFYATSLQNGQRGLQGNFRINTEGNKLEFQSDEDQFVQFSGQKKIIGPGIFSSYVEFDEVSNDSGVSIKRRLGSERINTPIDDVSYGVNDQALVSGIATTLRGYEFSGRITGYDDVIASFTKITKPNIKVQFLNPIRNESNGQWAEFRIGITAKKPEIKIDPNGDPDIPVLLFDDGPLDIEREISAEFSQFQPRRNLQGIETGELDPRYGNVMEQDPRIGNPRGASSGFCSEINFTITDIVTKGVSYVDQSPIEDPDFDDISHFIIYQNNPSLDDPIGGGIGVFDGNRFIDSGITFVTKVISYPRPDSPGQNNFIVGISDNITSIPNIDIEEDGIATKRVRCFGRFINTSKLFPFSSREYYVFVAMRDNARINNIVVRESDGTSTFSHTPNWQKDQSSNIDLIQIQNAPLSNGDVEYFGPDGRFSMGGISSTSGNPANFTEKRRLSSVNFDNQLFLPLRPSSLKTSIYIGGQKTTTLDMKHIFDVNRYKLKKGSFNNKYLYVSSILTEPGDGTIQLNISGREQ
jgi:hypothetical protein